MPETQPTPHRKSTYADEVNRTLVVAEAKLLVQQLDTYLELIGEWASEEEWEDNA